MRKWPFEQIIARQETSNISDRRLKEAHGLVISTDAPIDIRNVVDDLFYNLSVAHNEGGRKSVNCRSTPPIAVPISTSNITSIAVGIRSPRIAEAVAHREQLIVRERVPDQRISNSFWCVHSARSTNALVVPIPCGLESRFDGVCSLFRRRILVSLVIDACRQRHGVRRKGSGSEDERRAHGCAETMPKQKCGLGDMVKKRLLGAANANRRRDTNKSSSRSKGQAVSQSVEEKGRRDRRGSSRREYVGSNVSGERASMHARRYI